MRTVVCSKRRAENNSFALLYNGRIHYQDQLACTCANLADASYIFINNAVYILFILNLVVLLNLLNLL